MRFHTKKVSIEFFVDEASDLLLARETVLSDGGEAISSEEVLRLPLDNVRGREPAEIQRTIGRLVLSFLNSKSSKNLNLPRDLEDERRLDEEHFNQLLIAAKSNEPEAVYDLAVSLIARGMSNESWADIEQGEALLNQAVTAELPAAIKYQSETWVLIRPRLEQKLKCGKDGNGA